MSTERKSVVQHVVMPSGVVAFTVAGAGTFTFDPSGCTEDVEMQATLHGYVQKISDKAAIARDSKTGLSATPQMKYERMKALADHLAGGGSWNVRAAGVSLNRAALFESIAEVRKVSAAKVYEKFAGFEDKVLQSFLTHGEIAAAYARITAPKDSSQADALLEGLDA